MRSPCVPNETDTITVHYWASARAAAGVAGDSLPTPEPLTLAEVRRRAVELHPGTRLADVLAVCSTLVGDLPVGTADPATVVVPPGATVEFLPPFAGG
jgi:molybdopterin converting factor small subunit